MKKLLLAVIAVFGLNITQAQLPDYGVAPNFTVTDLDGNQHELYDILEQGKPVIIDMYATWCGPCWNYHQDHILEDLWTQYGDPGTGELFVMGIESQPGNTVDQINGIQGNTGNPYTSNTAGNWLTGISYPMIDDENPADLFNLGYFPTIVTVCPDRSTTETGQASVANHYAAASACPGVASDSTDGALLVYEGSGVACDNVQMGTVLQNKGTMPLTAATIKVMDGGNELASHDWTGNLMTYDYEEVDLGLVAVPGAGTYTVEIATPDANSSNDEVNATLVEPESSHTSTINFSLVCDQYGGETSWELLGPTGSVVESGGNYSANDQVNETWTLDNYSCYTFTIYDSYGDGICCQYGNGSYKLETTFGAVIAQGGQFADAETTGVVTDENVGIDESAAVVDLNFYPNPVTSNGTLVFTNVQSSEVTFEIVNTLGAKVISKDFGTLGAGTQIIPVSVDNLTTGMYLINVAVDGKTYTKRISVSK